jgi:hypothetical protein
MKKTAAPYFLQHLCFNSVDQIWNIYFRTQIPEMNPWRTILHHKIDKLLENKLWILVLTSNCPHYAAEENRIKGYTSGPPKVCSVPRGFELKDGYIKFNMKTENLKLKTDNALPYTHTHTKTQTHTQNVKKRDGDWLKSLLSWRGTITLKSGLNCPYIRVVSQYVSIK